MGSEGGGCKKLPSGGVPWAANTVILALAEREDIMVHWKSLETAVAPQGRRAPEWRSREAKRLFSSVVVGPRAPGPSMSKHDAPWT